ncbi:MAG: DNA mismatch repair endonuclease MutL, partial [Firmicutes bacterium]|nr:DNA mismatch repair endonuclease MutL [Bacillota bacterium]
MGRIVRLPPEAVEKIAAGEVIDRPAAVVKELLENAFDAGASYVVVDLAGGGTEAVTVADDGCGMDPEDARLAFSRHATSKIRGAEDLWRVTTLGFRGEALASIGAVARVSLVTRPADSLQGTAVEVEGGRIVGVGPAGCPPGTTVRVRDLFFNTPARRKYLRAPGAEAGAALDTAARLALGYPGVAVAARYNGREVWRTPGTGDTREVVAALFGGALAAKLLPVEAADGPVSVRGFAGPPEVSRSNRRHQVLLVNNRSVRVPGLLGPVQEAYRGLLPAGRFPVVILWLTVPPEEVDVNVHPAKLEVRLLRERMVAAMVYQALRRALRGGGVPAVP